MSDKDVVMGILASDLTDDEKWEAIDAFRAGRPIPPTKSEQLAALWPKRILVYAHAGKFYERHTAEEFGVEAGTDAADALRHLGYEVGLFYDVHEDGTTHLVGVKSDDGDFGDTSRAINKKP